MMKTIKNNLDLIKIFGVSALIGLVLLVGFATLATVGLAKADNPEITLKEALSVLAEYARQELLKTEETVAEEEELGYSAGVSHTSGSFVVNEGRGNVIIAQEGELDTDNATRTNGWLRWQAPDDILLVEPGIMLNTTGTNATSDIRAWCGILPNEEASSTLVYNDDTASTSGSLINSDVGSSTENIFTINSSDFANIRFATSVDKDDWVTCHATSFVPNWRGLCGGEDSCANSSSTPFHGRYKFFYINSLDE